MAPTLATGGPGEPCVFLGLDVHCVLGVRARHDTGGGFRHEEGLGELATVGPTASPDPVARGVVERVVRERLAQLGFIDNGDGYRLQDEITKQRIRDLHSGQRREVLARNRAFVRTHGREMVSYFAAGTEVEPNAIQPVLVEVMPGTTEARLFRFACLLWSVPVSQGFGRRLRFLVRDQRNGSLIGLFALGDPVFNLSARDTWIGWTHLDRADRLTHVMDAYVVGAVPPYSQLICGKLVAALMASREVIAAYDRKYLGRHAVITGRQNNARLVLLTTTSALGRSSIYNRLAVPGGPRFIRIGATRGFGHFHLTGDVFQLLRGYLSAIGHPYASGYRFGMGPNWRLRVARAALENLGIHGNSVLKHGIQREVYAVSLTPDFREVLLGICEPTDHVALCASEIANYCLSRWIVPRAQRDGEFRCFAPSEVLDRLAWDG